MKCHHFTCPLIALLLAVGCAPSDRSLQNPGRELLKRAQSPKLTTEQRAVLCLDAARDSSLMLTTDNSGEARNTYNKAAADLILLLSGEKSGAHWNRPLTLASGSSIYRLRFATKSRDGNYDPGWFTSFTRANEVDMDSVKNRYRRDGIGGTLVGVRKTSSSEPFSPNVGVTAPVTAVLDFNGNDVTLSLVDPTVKTKATIRGTASTLDADFSAPLAYYPHRSELWDGLMGAIHADEQMGITGLYQLQPYDPDRIPLVFVHGLISTPRMWRNVINEIGTDPVLRRRYQCLVFAYPTGNPPGYSALRLREALERFHEIHPDAKEIVMVGHSMGGLLTHMQSRCLMPIPSKRLTTASSVIAARATHPTVPTVWWNTGVRI